VSNLAVRLDNRARLVSAVLAASQWPEREQAQERHAVDPYAKLTRQYLAEFTSHPAAQLVNQGLDKGIPVEEFFTAALRCQWPTFEPAEPLPPALADGDWPAQLDHFYTDTAIAAFFWADHQALWDEVTNDLTRIFQSTPLPAFLGDLRGRPLEKEIVVVPNPLFPALRSIISETAAANYLILPLPKAYGESPPWPYREGVDWVLAESCLQLTSLLLADQLAQAGPDKAALLKQAAVVLFLEKAINEAEARAYLVRSKKQYQLPQLPTAVENLRAHLANPQGKGIIDFEV
jgi:hypothetical protein